MVDVNAIKIFLIASLVILAVGMVCYGVYVSKEKKRLLSSIRARAEALERFKKDFDKEITEIEKRYKEEEINREEYFEKKYNLLIKALRFSEAEGAIIQIQTPQRE